MAVDAHNLGEFASISDAWKLYPNGGGFGDYITVNGVRVDWNEYSRSWGEQTETGGTTRPDEVVPHSIDVQGTGTFRDGLKVGSYVKDTSGANIDQFGNAEFRNVQLDALMVKYGNSYVPLSEFIKTFKTELPPDWTEYTEIPLFDDVRLLVFDENSSEKFYTTIGALKAVIGSGGSSGGGAVNIEIIRSDEPDKTPTDNNVFSALKVLLEIQNRSISKVNKDTAQRLIQFIEGITIGDFETGLLGSGAAIKNVNGTTIAEVDQLLVRQRAEFFSVLIHEARSVGGQLIISAANLFCTKVEEFPDFYRCYFDSKNGEVANLFANTDFARSQIFTGARQKFYWRKVIAVGTDYIELSKTNAAINSDIPEVGDTIFQLGSTDVNRQGAMILSTVGIDAPSFIQYSGIDSFSLEGKELTKFTRLGNRVSGKTVFVSSGSNLDDWATGTSQDIQDAQSAANSAALAAQQAIDDAAANVTDYNAKFAAVQAQIDGEVSNWFYPYSPTLANYPASDWTTNTIKDRHIGDTFTNTQQAPATDAGKSWRFVKNGTVYSWTQIADSDAVLALQKAAQAQSTADGKSTTYLIQPTSYKLGDMWVLAADQTVNGVAYKSGEILTATQDSATYNQAHWVKRVRYTDDTAVNNMQLGVRNLILKGGERREIAAKVANWVGYTLSEPLKPNVTYRFIAETLQLPTSADNGIKLLNKVGGNNNDLRGLITRGSYFTTQYDDVVAVAFTKNLTTDTEPLIAQNVAIYEGNKCPDRFVEAPEDVQAEIDNAKQEALNAANSVQTNVNNLNTYVTGAFKDGLIDEAEAKAIEKYKNTINETMAKSESSFAKVFANTYLEGAAKTALENAKINLWGQRDTLLSTINNAIADGKTTVAEKNAVDSAFNTFNSLMSAFQNALEDANKAIQTRLDNIAKGYVNNLEIGGRNLFSNLNTVIGQSGLLAYSKQVGINGFYGAGNNNNYVNYVRLSDVITSNGVYTVSFQMRGTQSTVVGLYVSIAGVKSSTRFLTNNSNTYNERKYYTVEVTDYTINSHVDFHLQYAYFYIKDIKVEKGNKPTDWSPAPEDVQAGIDAAKLTAEQAQLQADGYMRARYVRDWTKGNTSNNLNQWSEIKIFNKAGINIALGKIPETNGVWNPTRPASNVTDNNIESNGATNENTPIVEHYAKIDLGSIIYDIDYIQVWHPYLDGRTYYGTKTEISTDGVNWTPVFDSAKSGTYKETAAGNIISFRPNEVLAKVLKGAAVTDTFKTTINGGLISTVMILLRELNSIIETAGVSGIQDDGYLPAYWSGGTYAEALAFGELMRAVDRGDNPIASATLNAKMSSIVMLHNGHAKVGELIIKSNGQIIILDKATGKIKFIINSQDIPSVADLMSGTTFGQTLNNAANSTTSSVTLPNAINVTKDNSVISFSASSATLAGTVRDANSGASLNIDLIRNGSHYANITGLLIRYDAPSETKNNISINFSGCPAGVYLVKLSVSAVGDVLSPQGSISTSVLSWNFTQSGVRYFQLGLNGLMAYYSDNHFHYTETGGLDVRGATNMPGVLLSGEVASAGGFASYWGAKKHASSTATKTATGTYTVYHNVGHSEYSVQITPQANRSCYVASKTASSFVVYFYTIGSTPALSDCGFNFTVFGKNYI